MEADDDEIPSLIVHGELESLRIPLTIICGFLGAGKSTFLKWVLTERHGYRIAVIMNEFGDTADIEAKTINVSSPDDPTAEQSEEFLELANGCLCCSIKDSGVAAIEQLMKRKGAFDYILLETTGLADPGPIASMFWQNEEFAMGLGRDICLDGVICVVDAMFGKKQMEEDHAVNGIGESLRQIACADVILLNKVDLVDIDELLLIEEQLSKVNPVAAVYRTVKGQVDLKHVMGVGAYSSTSKSWDFMPTTHDHDEGRCEQTHHLDGATHYEMRGIASLQVSCPVMLSSRLEKLDEWIRTVLWENRLPGGEEDTELQVLRCKGLFTMDSGEKYVLQGVRSMYEISRVAEEVVGVPEPGKLVLIGKGLTQTVRHSLEDTLFR